MNKLLLLLAFIPLTANGTEYDKPRIYTPYDHSSEVRQPSEYDKQREFERRTQIEKARESAQTGQKWGYTDRYTIK